ncbi:unnamed protein product [Tenebrio molitor]|nr:unnamed protein product [Tenebrio molitor]
MYSISMRKQTCLIEGEYNKNASAVARFCIFNFVGLIITPEIPVYNIYFCTKVDAHQHIVKERSNKFVIELSMNPSSYVVT